MLHAVRGWSMGFLLWIVCATGVLWANEADEAREIIAAAGVRAGVCLHLGCGREASAGLTAALAEGSGFVVHGLALDQAGLARAREKIEARGVLGRAMAEHVALNPLPYLSDLVNLVVVEDPAELAQQGLSKEEMLRVAAPGGVLLLKEGGKWSKTVKPRPAEMGEWTHTRHGADFNGYSEDKLVKLPAGFKWIDGLPVCINGWGSTRGWVIAGGRCYTYSSNERENLGPVRGKINYLGARDAFNGLPLWKIDCGPSTDVGAGLNFRNTSPLVADGQRVYAVQKEKLVAVEGSTGEVVLTFPTKFPAVRLLLLDGVLLASCWDGKAATKDDFDGSSLWPTWIPKSASGSMEAFETASGKLLWSVDYPAYMQMASDGVVYALTNTGNPPTERAIVALELKTGKEKWRAPHTEFGNLAGLQLNTCGAGYAVVSQRGGGNSTPMGGKKGEVYEPKSVHVLSAETGKVLWKIPNAANVFTPVVNGELWNGTSRYDPKTGEVKGTLPAPGLRSDSEMCTASYLVGNMQLRTRGGTIVQFELEANPPATKRPGFHGARGACIEGLVPANGMFYTAQNNCHCEAAHVYGFLALAPGAWPGKADFAKPRPVEKGPAFGAVEDEALKAADWPEYRHDSERSAATSSPVPEELKEAWKAKVAAPCEGQVGAAWKARLGSSVTAPVAAGGRVFAAGADLGQVVALDAATGAKIWSTVLGGRIDTPPTIYRGLCVVGCHDGWVYALRAKDGQLAWRTRVAPWERRMVAYGEVESVWPAYGTVVAHDGLLYANAGRTTESDGGVAVLAFDPATGATVWGRALPPNTMLLNDMLYCHEGNIGFCHMRMDPKTGANKSGGEFSGSSQGGMLDGTWTMVGKHRSGNAFKFGRISGDLMAWNDKTIVTPVLAIAREKAAKPKPDPAAKPGEGAAPAKPPALTAADYIWQPQAMKGYQIEALALAANAVVYAGRIDDAKAGKTSNFIRIVSLVDGKKLAEIPLDSPPTYDGIAVADGKIFISLQNGTLICFGN